MCLCKDTAWQQNFYSGLESISLGMGWGGIKICCNRKMNAYSPSILGAMLTSGAGLNVHSSPAWDSAQLWNITCLRLYLEYKWDSHVQ